MTHFVAQSLSCDFKQLLRRPGLNNCQGSCLQTRSTQFASPVSTCRDSALSLIKVQISESDVNNTTTCEAVVTFLIFRPHRVRFNGTFAQCLDRTRVGGWETEMEEKLPLVRGNVIDFLQNQRMSPGSTDGIF